MPVHVCAHLQDPGRNAAAGGLPAAGRTDKVAGAQERGVGVVAAPSAAKHVRQECCLDMPATTQNLCIKRAPGDVTGTHQIVAATPARWHTLSDSLIFVTHTILWAPHKDTFKSQQTWPSTCVHMLAASTSRA